MKKKMKESFRNIVLTSRLNSKSKLTFVLTFEIFHLMKFDVIPCDSVLKGVKKGYGNEPVKNNIENIAAGLNLEFLGYIVIFILCI